jgi:hypothetical protein
MRSTEALLETHEETQAEPRVEANEGVESFGMWSTETTSEVLERT